MCLLTSKGENALRTGNAGGLGVHPENPVTAIDKDKHALANLLETMKCEFLAYLKPEVDTAKNQ